MQYIKGTDRTQAILFPQSLDENIDQGNVLPVQDLCTDDEANCDYLLKTIQFKSYGTIEMH